MVGEEQREIKGRGEIREMREIKERVEIEEIKGRREIRGTRVEGILSGSEPSHQVK